MDFLSLFQHETEAVEFDAGETIIAADALLDAMYVLIAGDAEIRVGGQAVYATKPGDLLGEMALIDHAPSSSEVVAVTACKLIPINHKRFQFLVQQTPNFALGVMQVIANRLRNMNSQLAGQLIRV